MKLLTVALGAVSILSSVASAGQFFKSCEEEVSAAPFAPVGIGFGRKGNSNGNLDFIVVHRGWLPLDARPVLGLGRNEEELEAQPRLVPWQQRRQDDRAEQVCPFHFTPCGNCRQRKERDPNGGGTHDADFINSGNFRQSCSDCKPDQNTDRAPADFKLPPGISIPSLWINSDILQCNCVRKDKTVNLGTTIALSKCPLLSLARRVAACLLFFQY